VSQLVVLKSAHHTHSSLLYLALTAATMSTRLSLRCLALMATRLSVLYVTVMSTCLSAVSHTVDRCTLSGLTAGTTVISINHMLNTLLTDARRADEQCLSTSEGLTDIMTFARLSLLFDVFVMYALHCWVRLHQKHEPGEFSAFCESL